MRMEKRKRRHDWARNLHKSGRYCLSLEARHWFLERSYYELKRHSVPLTLGSVPRNDDSSIFHGCSSICGVLEHTILDMNHEESEFYTLDTTARKRWRSGSQPKEVTETIDVSKYFISYCVLDVSCLLASQLLPGQN